MWTSYLWRHLGAELGRVPSEATDREADPALTTAVAVRDAALRDDALAGEHEGTGPLRRTDTVAAPAQLQPPLSLVIPCN
jgi:hypothetical protein